MKTTRLMRVAWMLLVLAAGAWLMAASPAHSQTPRHLSLFWYGAAGLLASLVLYGLLSPRRSAAPMEKKYANAFRWITPTMGLFVAAALMEQDASAPKWQNIILVLYCLCGIIGIVGTMPFLFVLIRKR